MSYDKLSKEMNEIDPSTLDFNPDHYTKVKLPPKLPTYFPKDFNVIIFCDVCFEEMRYEITQYDPKLRHLNLQASCPECNNRIKVGIII